MYGNDAVMIVNKGLFPISGADILNVRRLRVDQHFQKNFGRMIAALEKYQSRPMFILLMLEMSLPCRKAQPRRSVGAVWSVPRWH
jgi:hypothetical protein